MKINIKCVCGASFEYEGEENVMMFPASAAPITVATHDIMVRNAIVWQERHKKCEGPKCSCRIIRSVENGCYDVVDDNCPIHGKDAQ